MPSPIIAIVLDPSRLLVVLRRDGTIARQVRIDGPDPVWREVPTEGITGRVIGLQISNDAEYPLVALTNSGAIFEQHRNPAAAFAYRPLPMLWRRVEGP